MADKQQNITINYKFNTADVDKANQSLNQANAASNKLQQAGAKAGQAIGAGFNQGTQSILSMQNSLIRLKTQIEVSTNPSKLKLLSREYQNLKAQMDAATKAAFGTNQALQQQGATATGLSARFGQLGTAVAAVITIAAVRQVVSMTLEMAKLAGNTEAVERAFKRAFPNSLELLNRLKAATHGTVTEFELMQRTLQATNLGVSVQRLPELLEFAAVRAQQTGVSVDYLVGSIVDGIGRKSIRILDNLGISATRLKDKFNGVALESLSVGQVTEGVAEVIREEMDKMGGYVETSATKVDQLTVSWEQLRTTIAKKVETGGFVGFLNGIIDKVSAGIKGARELFIESLRLEASQTATAIVESKAFKAFGENQQGKFDLIQQEINSRVELITEYNNSIAALKEERAEIEKTNPHDKKLENINNQIKAYNTNKFVLASVILTLKEYLKEINLANVAEEKSTGIIERKKEEIKKIQEQLEKTNKLGDLGVGGKLTIALEIAQAELGDLQRAFFDFNEIDFTKKFEKITKEVENAAKALGDISDVLAGIDADIKDGIKLPVTVVPPEFNPTDWQKFTDDLEKNWQNITSMGIDIQADQLKSMAESELDNYKQRLSTLQEFYDGQQSLAGDNERAKEQLRVREERETKKLRDEIARKEKQVRRTQVIIDIAAGIGKAFATYPWPYALIPAAFVAAQGASQLAIINRQPTSFAKGVINLKGPGTETSDSIPANLSRGESVMTAWETRHSGDVLKEIRAKKIDNKVLRDLKQGRAPVQQQVFNDDRIIKAIKEQKFPDVIEQSHIVYKSTKYNDEYRKRVRSRTMGL